MKTLRVSRMYHVKVGNTIAVLTENEAIRMRGELDRQFFDGGFPVKEAIIIAVCVFYHVTREQLFSRLRPESIVWPRQVAMYFMRHLTSDSLPAIGTIFSRDHGTILHGVRRVNDRASVEPAVSNELAAIKLEISRLLPKQTA